MKTYFGSTKDGVQTHLFVLENERITAKVSDYGATLVSLIDKESNLDVVQGFDCVEEYCEQTAYIGASIGRTSNRIAKGLFTLNGIEYRTPINNNGNCNHGGIEGFDKKVFETIRESDMSVSLRYLSKDTEEGYPGNLTVTITYTLTENGVEVKTEGISDQDTLFAYTLHSYFNMDESESCLDEKLKLYAERYALSDEDGLALDVLESVAGTPFDFREYKEIGKDLEADDRQLAYGHGYDHWYEVKGAGIRKMAELSGKKLKLTVYSDLPGIQVYTSNWFDTMQGKNGNTYMARSSCALEPSYMPNAIHYADAKKPLLKEGDTSVQTIRYILEKEKQGD